MPKAEEPGRLGTMTAAHPLPPPEDDLDVQPLTAADLADLPPEVRERARWADDEWAARRVSHPHEFTSQGEIEALVAQQRAEALASAPR